MSGIIDKAYESIRGYVPEDVNKMLSEQIPKIEQYIEEEVEIFGKELSSYIDTQVEQALAEAEADAEVVKNKMLAAIEEITADMSDTDATLRAATRDLKEAVDEYKEKFADLGRLVKSSVTAAIKSTGLPFA